MASINKVILVGHLGQDPEVKYMPSGGAVTNTSIATTAKWKDKASGQDQEQTEWHRVVFFNRLAEVVGEYLHKGSQIYIEGNLRTRKWKDQNGIDRYTTEIVAREMQMLGSANNNNANQAQPQQQRRPAGQANGASQQNDRPAQNHHDNFDDDIPF